FGYSYYQDNNWEHLFKNNFLFSKIGFTTKNDCSIGVLFSSDRNVSVYLIRMVNNSPNFTLVDEKGSDYKALKRLPLELQVVAIFDGKKNMTIVTKSGKALKYCFTPRDKLDSSVSICLITRLGIQSKLISLFSA